MPPVHDALTRVELSQHNERLDRVRDPVIPVRTERDVFVCACVTATRRTRESLLTYPTVWCNSLLCLLGYCIPCGIRNHGRAG